MSSAKIISLCQLDAELERLTGALAHAAWWLPSASKPWPRHARVDAPRIPQGQRVRAGYRRGRVAQRGLRGDVATVRSQRGQRAARAGAGIAVALRVRAAAVAARRGRQRHDPARRGAAHCCEWHRCRRRRRGRGGPRPNRVARTQQAPARLAAAFVTLTAHSEVLCPAVGSV